MSVWWLVGECCATVWQTVDHGKYGQLFALALEFQQYIYIYLFYGMSQTLILVHFYITYLNSIQRNKKYFRKESESERNEMIQA